MVYCEILFLQTEKRQKQILIWWCRETEPWEVDRALVMKSGDLAKSLLRGIALRTLRTQSVFNRHGIFLFLDLEFPVSTLLCNINFCCFKSWKIVFYISVINQVIHHCQCNLQNCKSSSQNWIIAQWDNVPGTSHFVKFWRSHTHTPPHNCSQVKGAPHLFTGLRSCRTQSQTQ